MGVVGTPTSCLLFYRNQGCTFEGGSESLGDTSPYRKLYQQFGAVCGNEELFLRKINL
jgi:hypothetical protein